MMNRIQPSTLALPLFAFAVATATTLDAQVTHGTGRNPMMSADGGIVVFHRNSGGNQQVFVRDQRTSVEILISQSTAGGGGNGDSTFPWMSSDGEFVVFESGATDLVTPATTSGIAHIYHWSRASGAITLVSAASSGTEGNGDSFFATCSDDGTVISYNSLASNLILGGNPTNDVFVTTLAAGSLTTQRISQTDAGAVLTIGGTPSGASIVQGGLSRDGSMIGYETAADNLVPDFNGSNDVFTVDLTPGASPRTTLVSTGPLPTGGGQGLTANSNSYDAVLSADGSVVAFTSEATNLSPQPGGALPDTNSADDVFVRAGGVITRVTPTPVAGGGAVQGNDLTRCDSISPSGAFLGLASLATNIAAGGTAPGLLHTYVFNRAPAPATADIRLASVDSLGMTQGNNSSGRTMVSADGRGAAFSSDATNLINSPTSDLGLINDGVRLDVIETPTTFTFRTWRTDPVTAGAGEPTLLFMIAVGGVPLATPIILASGNMDSNGVWNTGPLPSSGFPASAFTFQSFVGFPPIKIEASNTL